MIRNKRLASQTKPPGRVAPCLVKPLRCFALLGLFLSTACLLAVEPARTIGDLIALEDKVRTVSASSLPATVALLSGQTGASGSGVITSEEGLILTAAHVIQGSENVLVVFPNGKQVQGKVLGANYSKDIAMVQLEKSPKGKKWPHVDIGTSKPLQVGDWVVALGHSAGFDAARTPPIRFGRILSRGPGNFITTDCTLIGGDSGGPLFDLEGKLVGIHSSIGQSLSNNNHAGIDGFQEDWDRMLEGEAWGELSLNPFANPETPVLGINMAMNRRIKGVIVAGVVPRSPAALAGVRVGDVIVALDGKPIANGAELLRMMAKRRAGDTTTVGLVREDQSMKVKVTLMKRSELFSER